MISLEAVSSITGVISMQAQSHYTETLTVVRVQDEDGRWTEQSTKTQVAVVWFQPVVIPSYVLSYETHRIVIDVDKQENTIGPVVIIGLITGIGTVFVIFAMIVVALVRQHRSADDTSSWDETGSSQGSGTVETIGESMSVVLPTLILDEMDDWEDDYIENC